MFKIPVFIYFLVVIIVYWWLILICSSIVYIYFIILIFINCYKSMLSLTQAARLKVGCNLTISNKHF